MEMIDKKEVVTMYENEIAAIKDYLKYFPDDVAIQNKLFLYQCCQELGIKLNGSYYPRVSGYMMIELMNDIYARYNYHLTNSATGYQPNDKELLIVCSYPTGRLSFDVGYNEYHLVDDEWREFCDTLKSYHPLDYDDLNNNYIFDVEHGKQLVKDYKEIRRAITAKIRKKLALKTIEKKKEQLESLKRELGVF